MIEVGYELEMGVDAPSSTIRGAVKAIFPEIVDRNSSKARDKFTVTSDISVETNRYNSDVEIVTPVWTLKRGLKAIDKLFTLMELMNAQTNASCGLHINLGFSRKSETKKIDEAKLVLLVDEQKWLKAFKRTHNEFVEPMKKGLRLRKDDSQDKVFIKLKNKISDKVKYFEVAILRLEKPIQELSSDMKKIKDNLRDINVLFYGDNIKRRLDMQQIPTPSSRVGIIANEQKYSTASPTGTHINSFEIAKEEFFPLKSKVDLLVEKVKNLEDKMKSLGAPYTPGRYEN